MSITICPMCALTGHLSYIQIVRVFTGPNLTETVDWYCPTCRTTGHHPALGG